MKRVLSWLREPLVNGIDVDGSQRLELHRAMLQRKRMLQAVFAEFHHLFKTLDRELLSGKGMEIELGAGIAPMQESYPDVLATDVVESPQSDRTLDAEAMDLADNSVRTIYGQNCFHHFPHPDRFFRELARVLVPGGGAILLEPYYGPVAAFIFKRLFPTEGFDKAYQSWETPVMGPMKGANQALSYIVFVRDRTEFTRKHSALEIVYQAPVRNYLKYLLSGGLNFRQLLPDCFIESVGWAEKVLSPLNPWIALHHVIVLRKVASIPS
jgi:SAM-dependent methyltransferase